MANSGLFTNLIWTGFSQLLLTINLFETWTLRTNRWAAIVHAAQITAWRHWRARCVVRIDNFHHLVRHVFLVLWFAHKGFRSRLIPTWMRLPAAASCVIVTWLGFICVCCKGEQRDFEETDIIATGDNKKSKLSQQLATNMWQTKGKTRLLSYLGYSYL